MSNPNPQNQFKKGVSANPGGRPKRGWNWAKLFELAVEEELTTKDGTMTAQAKQFIVKKLVRMAVDGDMAAVKEIMNRMDGMPKQSTEIGGLDGGPLTIEIVDSTNANNE